MLDLAFAQTMTLVSTGHHYSVLRIYLLAAAQGFTYRLAAIPPRTQIDFPEIEFDAESMRGLFELGRERGSDPASWLDHPPFLEREELVP